MRDVAELGIDQEPNQKPADDAAVSEFEQRFRLRMPPGLRALLAAANGGAPTLNTIKMESPDGESDSVQVSRFYFLANGNEEPPGSIQWALRHWRDVIRGEMMIPFGRNGGGDLLFVDTASHEVKICLHDEEMRTLVVAPNFETFIDRLEVDDDPDLI